MNEFHSPGIFIYHKNREHTEIKIVERIALQIRALIDQHQRNA